eukprot:37835-Eustigmatos_ZCMA.PRE.1
MPLYMTTSRDSVPPDSGLLQPHGDAEHILYIMRSSKQAIDSNNSGRHPFRIMRMTTCEAMMMMYFPVVKSSSLVRCGH